MALIIGLLGAGGQMMLFYALTTGPAYLIFPVISLSPVVTIALSFLLLGERTDTLGAAGIVLALIALPLFDFSPQGLSEGKRAGLVPAVADCDGMLGRAGLLHEAREPHHARGEHLLLHDGGGAAACARRLGDDRLRPAGQLGCRGPYLAAASRCSTPSARSPWSMRSATARRSSSRRSPTPARR